MSDADTRGRLQQIFEDVMDVDDIELSDDTTADEVEEWDSLSHVRFIVAVERAFGIKFSNAEIESLTRFKDIVDLVGAKAAA